MAGITVMGKIVEVGKDHIKVHYEKDGLAAIVYFHPGIGDGAKKEFGALMFSDVEITITSKEER